MKVLLENAVLLNNGNKIKVKWKTLTKVLSLETWNWQFKVKESLTRGRVVVGADDEVCAEAVQMTAVLWVVNVVLEKHFFHPKMKNICNLRRDLYTR